VDVTNREEVFETVKKVQREVGDITLLINNAGIMPCRKFLDHTPEQIDSIFKVNVYAHFWVSGIVS
jgi:all-trans-retinol dehydrogenase (NAD+)